MAELTRYHVESKGLAETVQAEDEAEAARVALSIAAADGPVDLGTLIVVRDDNGGVWYVVSEKVIRQLGLHFQPVRGGLLTFPMTNEPAEGVRRQ